MGLMACNALDYLVAVALEMEVDAREDGVYLKDGTRWQPTVNWAQIGPIINKMDMGFDHIVSRYQPVMATSGGGVGISGETHQVAACNYVLWKSHKLKKDIHVPYKRVNSLDLEIRDRDFVKKYPLLKIDDIKIIEMINEIGVAAYLKWSAERNQKWLSACPKSLLPYCYDRAPGLIKTIVENYPELITIEAHAKGIEE